MGLRINKQPTETAFLLWMNAYPESFHPLDMERFYAFIKTKQRYRSLKWDCYDYFEKRIKKHSPKFSDEHIDYFWNEKYTIEEALRAHCVSRIELTAGDGLRTTQVNVINDKFIYTDITDEEYKKGGISLAEVKRRNKNI